MATPEKGDKKFGRSARREDEEKQVDAAIQNMRNERIPRLARRDAFVPPVETQQS
jgi:hypothetical protein